jgi:glutamate formiminotransferase
VEVRESEVIGLVPGEALDDETARHVKVAGYDPEKMILERRLERVKKG